MKRMANQNMKRIEVVAAIVIQDGLLFAAQRNAKGEVGSKWEFPGGKIEPGETHQAALARELNEELGVSAKIGGHFMTIEHSYTTFHLTMHCYLADFDGAQPTLREHLASRWLSRDELDSVDWAPADLPIVAKLREYLPPAPRRPDNSGGSMP